MNDPQIYKKQLKRYKLICCEIMFREACQVVSLCDSIVDPAFMPKELHDIGEQSMSSKLQEMIDQVDCEQYDAILLGYGLCNYGVLGLHAELPLVIPRAHDCITLLLGSRAKYDAYFQQNPGTFFKSPGWIERDADPADNPASTTSKLGISHSREELADKYDEEEAEYLMQVMGDWLANYSKLAYIDTHTGNSDKLIAEAQAQAKHLNLPFEKIDGATSILEALVAGDWCADSFLIVAPGEMIAVDDSDQSLCAQAFIP